MRLTHPRRLAKLSAVFTIDDRIPVYVKDEKDLATRIDELIAAGALAEADRSRCVFYLDCRPAFQWRWSTDAAAVRLKAQSDIRTPCATWLPKENHADASASACPGESLPRTRSGVDAGSSTRTSANQINDAESTPDDGTTSAC
jgi:hypothetical protein